MATGNAPMATVPVLPPPINTKEFFGDKNKDKDYTISAFIDHVNKAISLNKWSDTQAAAYATSYLRGPAATFLKKLTLDPDNADQTNRWSTLHPLLKPRFLKPTEGASDSADIMKNLKMKSDESYIDFADRCEVAKRQMDINLEEEHTATPGYKHIYRRDTIAFFLNGIQDKARSFLLDHHRDKDLEDLAKTAEDYCANNKEKGVQFMEEISDETSVDQLREIHIQALENQLQTWSKGTRAQPFQFTNPRAKATNRGRSGAQSNAPSNGRPRWVNSDAAWRQIQNFRGYERGRILCFKCWSFGSHYANNCTSSPRQRPQELNMVEPPQRRPRSTNASAASATPGGQQTAISPINNDPVADINPTGQLTSVLAGLQTQVSGMTNMMASLMRANSDTESNIDRPSTPYSGYLNYNAGP